MTNEKKRELRNARQSVRDGARESKEVAGAAHQGAGSVAYVRTPRGIARVVRGPDGQDWGSRLVERS